MQQHAKEDLESYPVQFDENNPRRNSLGSHIRCDICRIVQIVASMKHKRFALVGDSVQYQLFNGLSSLAKKRLFHPEKGCILAYFLTNGKKLNTHSHEFNIISFV